MRILLQFYKRVLNKHPVLTQTIQVGVVMGGGDVISQVVVEKKSYKEYNFLRTAQFSSVGLCFLVSITINNTIIII